MPSPKQHRGSRAKLVPEQELFETVAYVGLKDLVYPILVVAAVEVGCKLLLPSLYATLTFQVHVLNGTQCQIYLSSASSISVVDAVRAGI